MKIGNLSFEHPFILAPLAGITDSSFRRICRKFGCALSYSEMISAKALYYGDKNTKRLLHVTEEELPVAYQLFGSEPEMIGYAVEKIKDYPHCMVDLNMGCPVPKVVKNGEGSALLKNLDLAGKIIEMAVKVSDRPVSVKIRTGWDERSINAVEMAKVAEAAGASAVAVHGRTREQYYSGKADWKTIAQVKEVLKIPVIGNGDVFTGEDGMKMLTKTNVDFVMVARGALGNPWIFQELLALWKGVEVPQKPGQKAIAEVMRMQFDMMLEEKGEYAAVREMRKHVGWYLKGFKGAAKMRQEVNRIEKASELRSFLTFSGS